LFIIAFCRHFERGARNRIIPISCPYFSLPTAAFVLLFPLLLWLLLLFPLSIVITAVVVVILAKRGSPAGGVIVFFEKIQPSCKNPARTLPWTTPD
jgi:hypothetical protein